MNQAGSVALIAALAFAVYGVVAGALGGTMRSLRLTRSAERATLAFFVMITLAVAALEVLILTITSTTLTSPHIPTATCRSITKLQRCGPGRKARCSSGRGCFRFTAAWRFSLNHRKNRQLMPYVVAILMATGAFFTSLVFFVANPFQRTHLDERGGHAGASPRRTATA